MMKNFWNTGNKSVRNWKGDWTMKIGWWVFSVEEWTWKLFRLVSRPGGSFCRPPRCQLTRASDSEDLALSTGLDPKWDLTSSKVPCSLILNLYWISLPLRLNEFDSRGRNFLISLNGHQQLPCWNAWYFQPNLLLTSRSGLTTLYYFQPRKYKWTLDCERSEAQNKVGEYSDWPT